MALKSSSVFHWCELHCWFYYKAAECFRPEAAIPRCCPQCCIPIFSKALFWSWWRHSWGYAGFEVLLTNDSEIEYLFSGVAPCSECRLFFKNNILLLWCQINFNIFLRGVSIKLIVRQAYKHLRSPLLRFDMTSNCVHSGHVYHNLLKTNVNQYIYSAVEQTCTSSAGKLSLLTPSLS